MNHCGNRRKIAGTFLAIAISSGIVTACTDTVSPSETLHLQATSELEYHSLSIVKKRTEAYNAHDLDAFLAVYHPNVRVYEYPEKFLGEGRDRMGQIFEGQFEAGEGNIQVHSRHALGNIVISDETVKRFNWIEHNIGIYTIEDGLIVEVRLIEPEFPTEVE